MVIYELRILQRGNHNEAFKHSYLYGMSRGHFKNPKQLDQFSSREGDRITLERGIRPMKGYFRFSRYLQNAELLTGWAEWFNLKGIPWFIERKSDSSHPNNCFLFALWRQGKEAIAPGSKRIKDEKPSMLWDQGFKQ